MTKFSVCILAALPVLFVPRSLLALENNATHLTPLTVTGQQAGPAEQELASLQHEQGLVPGGTTIVGPEDLNQRHMANLSDMLRYVPGIWTGNTSIGGTGFISSRGSNLDGVDYDGNGVKLLIDGLPVTAADGNNHNTFIDPLSARHATIARGANALTYGASTLGGAINFISPTGRTTQNQVYVNKGSHGTLQGRATLGGASDTLDAIVTLEGSRYDGFRHHQQQKSQNFYTNIGWQINDSTTNRFYVSHGKNDSELAGSLTRQQFQENPYQANPSNAAGNYQRDVDTWRFSNRLQWNIDSKSQLTFGLSYESQSLYHPIVESPFFSLLIDNDQNIFGSTIRYQTQLDNHDLHLGIDYGQSRVKGGNYQHTQGRRGNLSTHIDNSADTLTLFAMDHWHLANRWTLAYGAQATSSHREVRNTNADNGNLRNPEDDYFSLNPRIGLTYQVTPESQIFGNLSRLYEAPTLYQLEDEVQGSESTLDAMSGLSAEIGTRGRASLGHNSGWHWELAAYYAELNDEILSREDPSAPGTSLTTNIDNTIHAGIEATIGASFALGSTEHRIEPVASLTYNHFTFDDDRLYGNNRLPVAPDYFLKGEVIYRHASGFFAGPTFDVVNKRYADFMNTYEVDGYELLGLRAGWEQDNWEVYVEGRNLTDKAHVAHIGVRDLATDNDALLQAGEPRSIYAGVRVTF